MAVSNGVQILNRVPRDKLPQVLAHILDKRVEQVRQANGPTVTTNASVFTEEEMRQLTEMLQLTERDIDAVVAAATSIFQEAAAFGFETATLETEELESGVLTVIEKLWRKKGRHVADSLAHAFPIHTSTPLATKTLKQSHWRLQMELGSKYQSNQSAPTAIFQLEMEDHAKAKVEKLDIEMDHGELFVFFQQLNAIQKELDDSDSVS